MSPPGTAKSSPADLVLLQFPVESVGRLLVSVLDGNVLPQGHLGSVQPGSDGAQRTRQGLVQVDVPVQQLRLTPVQKKKKKKVDTRQDFSIQVLSHKDVPTHPDGHAIPRLLDQRLVRRQLAVLVERLQQRIRLLLLHFVLHAEVLEGLRKKDDAVGTGGLNATAAEFPKRTPTVAT